MKAKCTNKMKMTTSKKKHQTTKSKSNYISNNQFTNKAGELDSKTCIQINSKEEMQLLGISQEQKDSNSMRIRDTMRTLRSNHRATSIIMIEMETTTKV